MSNLQDSKNANALLNKSAGRFEVKSYELNSNAADVPLNKTAGRFYMQKFISNFAQDKTLYKEFFYGTDDKDTAKRLFAKFVGIINLETNSYCNRKCHYCPMSLVNRGVNTQMNERVFDKILQDLAQINFASSISLNLYNEPLSDKNLLSKIKTIKAKLPKAFLRFNSNGDFLTPSLLKELENAGLNYLNITLHTKAANSYSDEASLVNLDKFYKRLGIAKPEFSITPKVAVNSSVKFGDLTLAVNTSNYDVYGTDRGGGFEKFEFSRAA